MAGKRLFTMTHREVYELFRAWGWSDGPERGDGHRRMVKQIAVENSDGFYVASVQICAPERSGTSELGNSLAIKEAAGLMGMSINKFLDGPGKDEARLERARQRQDEIIKQAERQAYQRQKADERVAKTQEDAVASTNTKNGHDTGATPALLSTLAKFPNQRKKAAAWADLFFVDHPQFAGQIDAARIAIYLSQQAKLKTAPKNGDWRVHRTGRGEYVYKQTVIEAPVIEAPAPAPEPAPAVAPPAPPVTPPPAPPTVNTNGNAPDLLSKVRSLSGGRYLFEGDDGDLYVVAAVVRLEV